MEKAVRKKMGNPLVIGIIEKAGGGAVVEHLQEPILKIKGAIVENYHYVGTNPLHRRRFVTVKVTNIGLKSATDCWGLISIPELGLTDVPLHWVDASYEIKRDSMDSITIPPTISRELDVAFSVYGEEYNEEIMSKTSGDPVIVTGGTISTNPHDGKTTTTTTKSREPTSVTLAPELITHPTGSRYVEDFPTDSKRKGAWLATHEVLSDPRETSKHYLPSAIHPRRYEGKIRVLCGNGSGDELPIVLISTREPSGLLFDWRTTPSV